MTSPKKQLIPFFAFPMLVLICCSSASAWEWTDLIIGDRQSSSSSSRSDSMTPPFLTLTEVSQLRVRDIKWRLARHHGYSAEELGQMIDKKDLIHALAYAEEQSRLKSEAESKRSVIFQGMFFSFVAMVAVFLWPLIAQALEVGAVNLIVYKDRKVHEARRCMELKSPTAVLGVVLMGILDILQGWLSLSVLLSWFIRSKYFFPTPNLPFRPGQFMGQEIANSSAGNYGINLGSMAVTWMMRFVHGKVEQWTGRSMAAAYRQKASTDKANRKEAKRQAKEEAERAKKDIMESHQQEFLDHIENQETQFDCLD